MPRTHKKCKIQKQYLYALVNRINNQTYFGITNNFNNRMKSHKNYTIDNNRKLYNSIKKYGWKNFDKEIIEVVYCRTEVFELEKFYIEEFDTFRNGLNSTPGGDGNGVRGDNVCAVKIRSYNIRTEEERVYDCLLDAADECDVSANAISKVIRGRIKRTGDYMFQRYDENDPHKPFDPSVVLSPAEVRKKASKASRESKKLAVIGTHKSGHTIEFEAIIDTGKELHIGAGHITNCCRGIRGYAGDYTWRYKDDTLHAKYPRWVPSKTGAPSDGKVYRFLPDGTKDIYLSASEAQTKLNIKHVRRSIENGWKSGGYRWYDLNPEEYDAREKRRPRYEGKVFRILEDGTRDEYTSSGEAKRILKIGHIPRAIKTGMKAGGYNWYDVI